MQAVPSSMCARRRSRVNKHRLHLLRFVVVLWYNELHKPTVTSKPKPVQQVRNILTCREIQLVVRHVVEAASPRNCTMEWNVVYSRCDTRMLSRQLLAPTKHQLSLSGQFVRRGRAILRARAMIVNPRR